MASDATSGAEDFILEGIGRSLRDFMRRHAANTQHVVACGIFTDSVASRFAESTATTWQTARDPAYFCSGGVPYL